jgi:hypothetical protein
LLNCRIDDPDNRQDGDEDSAAPIPRERHIPRHDKSNRKYDCSDYRIPVAANLPIRMGIVGHGFFSN